MSALVNSKRIGRNTKLENSSADFRTLNYPGESTNSYNPVDESEWVSDISVNIVNNDSMDCDCSPCCIFEVFLQYLRKIKLSPDKLI